MTAAGTKEGLEALPQELRFVFAPLVKRALGFAVGAVLGGTVFVLTLVHCALAALGVTGPAGESPEAGSWLWLLAQYFAGYSPSLGGAFIGLLWGFWTGFVMGWFLAFLRNLLIGAWIFWVRAREQLASDRDFLDHI